MLVCRDTSQDTTENRVEEGIGITKQRMQIMIPPLHETNYQNSVAIFLYHVTFQLQNSAADEMRVGAGKKGEIK